jgi:putative tricarboxylic transport membrane protein
MKTFSVYNAILIAFAILICVGSLKLGFGSFSDPGAGFMPFLSGALLIVLCATDLISGALRGWKEEKTDRDIWSDIQWKRIIAAIASLVIYAVLIPLLGFSIPTLFFLLFLFRLIDKRPWWRATLMAVCFTGLFYIGFGVALGAQLPKGIFGF